ncbi:hypothetical protein NDU88_004074 [Pleurodeles waltl]|uniref:Uncharacterized protein n=1 Tax=Pleurodeles waltl TaxID=8319 RepID=A0AAV7LH33_PLEWA|nr:hypothetical protein NDU88_004074 [Pleurodeles waltl]
MPNYRRGAQNPPTPKAAATLHSAVSSELRAPSSELQAPCSEREPPKSSPRPPKAAVAVAAVAAAAVFVLRAPMELRSDVSHPVPACRTPITNYWISLALLELLEVACCSCKPFHIVSFKLRFETLTPWVRNCCKSRLLSTGGLPDNSSLGDCSASH